MRISLPGRQGAAEDPPTGPATIAESGHGGPCSAPGLVPGTHGMGDAGRDRQAE